MRDPDPLVTECPSLVHFSGVLCVFLVAHQQQMG